MNSTLQFASILPPDCTMHIYIPPIQSKSSCDATSLALLLVDGCGSFCGTDVDVTLLLVDKSFPEFRPNKSKAEDFSVGGGC